MHSGALWLGKEANLDGIWMLALLKPCRTTQCQLLAKRLGMVHVVRAPVEGSASGRDSHGLNDSGLGDAPPRETGGAFAQHGAGSLEMRGDLLRLRAKRWTKCHRNTSATKKHVL